ncbi:sulfite reductase (NADPH) flavoprotein alpha-component [Pseudomonas duriflava]|uniref:Sulfite reductase (NADPH) flavoprotein alpha-component n=1 Tax=Pseudomonas duriflava TaxID=459528 RepID=A0A562QC84_9PSED|nr:sulfite reductase flavoprotein subunit alpha [Pseudomonas duriflava]TWI54375.1 sulfite reductase (NADPH) flavoprotein alpha-component [Pseudomonas duriflava]
MKKILFQLHWLLGITAGLVLAVVGVTGAAYSFESEILQLLNPQSVRVDTQGTGILSPGELVRRVEASEQKRVTGLAMELQDGKAGRVFFMPPPGERRGPMRLVDPFTADVLGPPRGAAFFGLMLQLHRFLAMGETGKAITGASTLALVFFCLSGLYLRWPRKALNWRVWLTLDWAKRGRSFNWDLHSVAGTWCLALYLLAALTGLFWSYEWYRNGLIHVLSDGPAQSRGEHGPGRQKPGGTSTDIDYDKLWASVQVSTGPGLEAYNLRFPPAEGQPVTVLYRLEGAAHPRAFNQLEIDPLTGEVRRHERYTEKSLKSQLLASVYVLHSGEYFGLTGRILMFLASLLVPLFFITGWLLYLDRRRKKREIRAARGVVASVDHNSDWLIGFASQSGTAEQLAWQTAYRLQTAGQAVSVLSLAQLTAERLAQANRALFVVSTFGDGEAPDSARRFERRLLGQDLTLDRLKYAVLALGDRQYPAFCGFGRRLQAWLGSRGAQTLFETVEVDRDDAIALARWNQGLIDLGAPLATPASVPLEEWRLVSRTCLNSQGEGWRTYRLALQSVSGAQWAAGDLIEILPRHPEEHVACWLAPLGLDPQTLVCVDGLDLTLGQALAARLLPDNPQHLIGMHAQALVEALIPLSVRQYSIASVPAEGLATLLVRQEKKSSGEWGIASGGLTLHTALNDVVWARIRPNPAFHIPADDRPVILIGNGTGMAGLRSLLKARIEAGYTHNWLIFGERNAQHDYYFREDIERWWDQGQLARLDLAFSRDQAEKIYVQDRLYESSEELRKWIAQGASLYVCGSLQGMAKGVHAMLIKVLGEEQVEQLLEEGRYKRDVY